MIEPYQLIPQYQKLQQLCRKNDLRWIPEPGDMFMYLGQSHTVLSVQGTTLALMNNIAEIPFDVDDILYVHNWSTNQDCLFCPGIAHLLQLIWDRTSLYPTMIPGIEVGREVWKVQHPMADPLIYQSLREALLDLSIGLLEKES